MLKKRVRNFYPAKYPNLYIDINSLQFYAIKDCGENLEKAKLAILGQIYNRIRQNFRKTSFYTV